MTARGPGRSRVTLDDRRELSYDDRPLLAIGAEPRRISIAHDLDGVYDLRTVEDCDVSRARPHGSPRLMGAAREIDHGLVVDHVLATSAPGAFAAGEMATARHPSYERRTRVEHWANTLDQGHRSDGSPGGGDGASR